MRPREYEALVAAHIEAEGYTIEVTGGVGDDGVDVFATRGDERLAVQCKMCGGTTRSVNRVALMQLHGAAAYFGCPSAVLATDGALMESAQEVADRLGIRVLHLPTWAVPATPQSSSSVPSSRRDANDA